MNYIIGCDLGKRRNPATIAIGRAVQTLQGGPPSGGGMLIGRSEEIIYPELHIVRLEEFPLGTPYRDVVARYIELDTHIELARNCQFVVDASGVGEPVMELVRSRIPEAIGVYSTSGTHPRRMSEETADYAVPKADLAMALMLWYQSERIRVNQGNEHTIEGRRQAEVFKKYEQQLATFREEVTASHNRVYGQEDDVASHFDLVIAVSMVCWWARQLWGIDRPLKPEEEFSEAQVDVYDPYTMLHE